MIWAPSNAKVERSWCIWIVVVFPEFRFQENPKEASLWRWRCIKYHHLTNRVVIDGSLWTFVTKRVNNHDARLRRSACNGWSRISKLNAFLYLNGSGASKWLDSIVKEVDMSKIWLLTWPTTSFWSPRDVSGSCRACRWPYVSEKDSKRHRFRIYQPWLNVEKWRI